MFIFRYIIVFCLTFIILDIILSYFFEKEIYILSNNKIDIISEQKSNKQVNWANVENVWQIPYWDAEYRWPFLDYKNEKKLNCRISWFWDSIIWWSWVSKWETYMDFLSNEYLNTEILNFWIPWSDLLQQIIKFDKTNIKDSDLIIWHIWEDDKHIYNNINGVLYDSRLKLNNLRVVLCL